MQGAGRQHTHFAYQQADQAHLHGTSPREYSRSFSFPKGLCFPSSLSQEISSNKTVPITSYRILALFFHIPSPSLQKETKGNSPIFTPWAHHQQPLQSTRIMVPDQLLEQIHFPVIFVNITANCLIRGARIQAAQPTSLFFLVKSKNIARQQSGAGVVSQRKQKTTKEMGERGHTQLQEPQISLLFSNACELTTVNGILSSAESSNAESTMKISPIPSSKTPTYNIDTFLNLISASNRLIYAIGSLTVLVHKH